MHRILKQSPRGVTIEITSTTPDGTLIAGGVCGRRVFYSGAALTEAGLSADYPLTEHDAEYLVGTQWPTKILRMGDIVR